MRAPWLSFTKDSSTLNFLNLWFFAIIIMAITWSIHIRYSQHDSGLSSMLWNKSFLRILLRMKSTYALASETLELRKIIYIRMRIILQEWGWHPILFRLSFDKSISYIFNCNDLLCIYFLIPQFQHMKVIRSTLSKTNTFGTSPDGRL